MSQQEPPQPYAPYQEDRRYGSSGQNGSDSNSASLYGQHEEWRLPHPPEAYLPGQPLPSALPGMAAPPSQYGQGPLQRGYHSGDYDDTPPHISPYETEPAREWIAPLIIMLIVAIVLVSGGAVYALTRGGGTTASSGALATATATDRPTATPTPLSLPKGFAVYTDPASNFRIFVPNGWQTQAGSPLVSFSSEPDLALLSVGYETPATALLDDDLDATLSQLISTEGGTLYNRHGPTGATLGEESGAEVLGDWSKNGFSFHIVLLGANHKNGTGIVAYLAPQNAFTGIDDRFFKTMVQSFTFLR